MMDEDELVLELGAEMELWARFESDGSFEGTAVGFGIDTHIKLKPEAWKKFLELAGLTEGDLDQLTA